MTCSYDAKHFAPTAGRWNAVPVIYVETGPGSPQNIPFEDVITRTLPAKVPHGRQRTPPPI